MNKEFHIVLVCHCEHVWWEDGTEAFDMSLTAMHELQQRVSVQLNKPVASTICACVNHLDDGSVQVEIEHSMGLIQTLLEAGNEVGLHTHVPIHDLPKGLQDTRIPEDVERLVSIGLPSPKTYVAGDFVTNPDLARYLGAAGIQVDCSVINFWGRLKRFGAIMEYDRRESLGPYVASTTEVVDEGDSKVVELPVSGAIVEFAKPEFDGIPPVVERIESRYQSLMEGVDIFQMYWHPFEVLRRGGLDWRTLGEQGRSGLSPDEKPEPDHEVLNAYEEFLLDFAKRDDVMISTAISAATNWRNGRTTIFGGMS